MNGYLKRSGLVTAALVVCAGLTPSAQGASFDCGKAATKVEHIICDDPVISKLDDELSVDYKAALKDQTQAESIKQVQKQWLKVRNNCVDSACVKQAYETRLAVITRSKVQGASHIWFDLSEKERALRVKEFLLTTNVALRSGSSENDLERFRFCTQFLEDFKRQKNVEYVEPKFKTNEYNHPELIKLRNQCPSTRGAWIEPQKCDSQYLAYWLKDYQEGSVASQMKADDICAKQFGTDDIALYEIDFGDHKEYVTYQGRTPKIEHDALLNLLREPPDKQESIYRTNTVVNVFFSMSGYKAMDYSICGNNAIASLATGGVTSSESHQGLIKYSDKFYAYNWVYFGNRTREYAAHRLGHRAPEYSFILAGDNQFCYFDVVQPKPFNTGSGK